MNVTALNPEDGGVLVFPASFAQQRLCFLDQLFPDSSVYHIQFSVTFNLPLDAAALDQAVNEICRRHESIRTTFQCVDGEPLQVIVPTLKFNLPCIDVSNLSWPQRYTELERLSRQQSKTPFDLRKGPLLRLQLVKLSEDKQVLVVSMHHIISDGWS